MTSAPAGFADAPPHVAQRSRRDKLRFPPAADLMFPPTTPSFHDHDATAHLGYLHAVVAPPPPPTDLWLSPHLYADASACSWPRAKLEQDHDACACGFTTQHQQAAALSLTLSPAPAPACGGSLQSVVGSASAPARPLGPFTGYAAVLKGGSRFLRPAQQLLDEICAVLGGGAEGTSGSYTLASPSSLTSSTDTADRQHQRSEFREKKAKLLYMQEEVCKRYKQYHQQMQMVVSSFESIPGISSTTPYASSILKAISRHFGRVRSIIASQIRYISRLLGEELLSLPSCSSGGKTVTRSSGLIDERQPQPVWRPQRGLPERAVSVMRAWLFDNFLHPYPTDSDKHMLATQTGLSRNQVSNWFINARVRLWKPMVEEIHMLENKIRGSANTDTSPAWSSPSSAAFASRPPPPLPVPAGSGSHRHQQLQMLEQCLGDAGGQAMRSFGEAAAPFAGTGDMAAGFSSVSLTLGLRRDQQQQQHQFGMLGLGDLVG